MDLSGTVQLRTHETTLAGAVDVIGIGVHSGNEARMRLMPAAPDSGIRFLITPQDGGEQRVLKADWSLVQSTTLCTVIGDGSAGQVATVEHLLSALAGLGVDNVDIEIDGNEVPVMDGSASEFVAAIDDVGLVDQAARRKYLRVLRPIHVENSDSFGSYYPYDGQRIEVTIDFPEKVIGKQSFCSEMTSDVFREELAAARTFGRVSDVEKLWDMGLARGSSLKNSVALSGDNILNPEGVRWADEFVRHKALDAVGDMALAGLPILGKLVTYKGGHGINHKLLTALFSDAANYEICELSQMSWGRLPADLHSEERVASDVR